MSGNTTEILKPEQHVETMPQMDPISLDDSLEAAVTLAEKQVAILEKVLKIALKRTNERDWFDQGGFPYLGGSGAEKLKPVFGVSMFDMSREKIFSKDDEGQYYIYEYRATYKWKGGSTMAIGTCSSRDKFFAWNSVDKIYKPLSQVDETNIMKSAYTNMEVNGVTRLLGLRNLTWEQLSELGFDRNKISKVEYKNSKTDKSEEHQMRTEIREMLLEIGGNDNSKARDNLKQLTSFQGKDGMVPGVETVDRLSGKRLEIAHSNAKKEYDKFQSEMRAEQ